MERGKEAWVAWPGALYAASFAVGSRFGVSSLGLSILKKYKKMLVLKSDLSVAP